MTRIVKFQKKCTRNNPERDEQIKFVNWLRANGFKYFNHSPSGGKRSLLEAINFKRMGVSRGFPDIEVPWPSGELCGFYVEMKAKDGKPTQEQLDWLQYLREKGYFAEVAHGFEEARDMFLNYLSLTKPAA